MTPIAAIARRTVVDSFGTAGPLGGGAGGCSMGSALDNRLAALRAELHVAGDLVAVRAAERLRRAAFSAELQARRDRLAALDARLAARGDRRATLRARPLLGLLLGDHPRHLRGHPVPEADAGAESDPGAGAAGGVC